MLKEDGQAHRDLKRMNHIEMKLIILIHLIGSIQFNNVLLIDSLIFEFLRDIALLFSSGYL